MVHDSLWNEVCSKHNIPSKVIVCKDCFEKLLGRKLTEDDLTGCPLNREHKEYILT